MRNDNKYLADFCMVLRALSFNTLKIQTKNKLIVILNSFKYIHRKEFQTYKFSSK